jgi:hypothetical protein
MSGGAFNYNQYKIRDIYQDIESELEKQGRKKPKEKLWCSKEYYDTYPEEKFEQTYIDEVQQIFRDGIEILKKAEVYAQRIDWYLSGDDGEESLIKRLKEDLEKL